MTNEEIEKLIHKIDRLTLILGYSMAFINETARKTQEDDDKFMWIVRAIENVVYMDKPLPPMP